MAHGVPVSAAMASEIAAIPVTAPLGIALQRTLEGFQRDFPVITDEGRVVGVLGREAILHALATTGADTLVETIMDSEPLVLHPNDNLEDAFMKLLSSNKSALVVDDRGRLVGLMTSESLGEFMLVRTALEQRASHSTRVLSRA